MHWNKKMMNMIRSKLWLVLDGSWVLSAHVQQDLYQVFVFTTTKHHWPVFWPPQDVRLDISPQRARHKHSTFILDNLATSSWKPWNNTQKFICHIYHLAVHFTSINNILLSNIFTKQPQNHKDLWFQLHKKKQFPPFLVTLRWEFLTPKKSTESTLEVPWLCTATVARLF